MIGGRPSDVVRCWALASVAPRNSELKTNKVTHFGLAFAPACRFLTTLFLLAAILVWPAAPDSRAFNEAWGLPEMAKVELWPSVGLARNGGQAGLVLRF